MFNVHVVKTGDEEHPSNFTDKFVVIFLRYFYQIKVQIQSSAEHNEL